MIVTNFKMVNYFVTHVNRVMIFLFALIAYMDIRKMVYLVYALIVMITLFQEVL